MKNLLLINSNLFNPVVVSSLLYRMNKQYNTYCLDDSWNSLFSFYKCKKISKNNIKNVNFNVLINMSMDSEYCKIAKELKIPEKYGFYYDNNAINFFNKLAKKWYDVFVLKNETKSNEFQITYSFVNLIWDGSGYNLNYFPRSKTRKNSIGLITQDSKLKDYLKNNLKLGYIYDVPFKKNILKQIDEVNRCKSIITDSEFIMHIALALRKQVEYISDKKKNYKIEMFNSGNIHIYNKSLYK